MSITIRGILSSIHPPCAASVLLVEPSQQCTSILRRDSGTILWRVEWKVPTLEILKWVGIPIISLQHCAIPIISHLEDQSACYMATPPTLISIHQSSVQQIRFCCTSCPSHHIVLQPLDVGFLLLSSDHGKMLSLSISLIKERSSTFARERERSFARVFHSAYCDEAQ